MKFYFTGIQHKHDGTEIPFQEVTYNTVDEYLSRYHHEMDYALSAVDILDGCTIVVYDSTGAILISDHWMRTVDGQQIAIPPIEGTE